MGAGSMDLLGWRRANHALYEDVRRTADQDPAAAHALWRARRDVMFTTDPATPLRPGDPRFFDGLRYGAYDEALRFTVPVEPAEPAGFTAQTGTDGEVGFERLGRVTLGDLGTLDVWWITGYGGGLWLPVRDGGSGSLSYGGGRYVLDTVKGADLGSGPGALVDGERPGGASASPGEPLVVDLNFLYPPSCAYDPAWACPLAPPGNRLEAVLEVGELA